MAEAIQLAQLNRLTRTAVKLIKGVQILQTDQDFEFAVFSVIGWFKVCPKLVVYFVYCAEMASTNI